MARTGPSIRLLTTQPSSAASSVVMASPVIE
jgi:hypothetical protein